MSTSKKKQKKADQAKKFDRKVEKLNLHGIKKHFFVCNGPKCCSEKVGSEAWKKIKELCKDQDVVFRSRANCLRLCLEGPIGVVYPEGVWYRDLDTENIEKVFHQHLIGGEVVDELQIKPLDLQKEIE